MGVFKGAGLLAVGIGVVGVVLVLRFRQQTEPTIDLRKVPGAALDVVTGLGKTARSLISSWI